ncbi:alanine racemase [Sorangium sp. So ce296]|uniref:diaminopimelate decarboxylase family protein n=1 Tax=Sorangium sp. So ce296 TaxID=3133296 RepID=UPI003F608F87
MIVNDLAAKRRRIEQLLDDEHAYPTGNLDHIAAKILEKRGAILDVAAGRATPFYLYDREYFRSALAEFVAAFGAHLPGHRPFYAVKSNPHPGVIEEAVRHGFGLYVSSGRELRQGLAIPGCPILFSGPAKLLEELHLAVLHADRVIVNIDSFRELERLGELAARLGRSIRAGVRVPVEHHSAWSKFGIPLAELPRFWRAAREHPLVELQGIQLHLSSHRDLAAYEGIIEQLGRFLERELTAEERASIAFVDVGGGYWPHRVEGYSPELHPLGKVIRAADAHYGQDTEFAQAYYLRESFPLEEYARALGGAIDLHLRPLLDCVYYTEPGRIVSTYAMHIVLTVMDKKSEDLVIVDGGVTMVGAPRYLHTYCPVINLSRPAMREIPVRIGGSLCDSEDFWGFRCYGERIEEGDVLIVPLQGAYTFCLAQDFVRPIPPVVELDHPGDERARGPG